MRATTRNQRILARTALGTVATLVALTGIGACTGSGGSGGSGAAARSAAVGAPGNGLSVPQPGDVASGGASAGSGSAAGTGSGSGSGSGKSAGASTDGTDLGTLSLGPSRIRTANMQVTVHRGVSVTVQADAAAAIAIGAGGEVDSDNRTSGRYATATMLLRVPPDSLTGVLDQLSRLGTEVARQVSTQDVTAQVADVTSRVASAQDAIARLRVLYQHATRIADIISIESELSGRESDLEALQATQRALAAQTSLAAVTLTLTAHSPVAPQPATQHHHTGFVGGLQRGWDAFARGATWIATAAGAALPFVLLVGVLALVARLLWPRVRFDRRVTPAPTPAPPE